jgi:tRNA (mo5U34)-methyltransferase
MVPALSDTEIRARIDAVPHWYHQIEIRPGIVTPGINKSAATLGRLGLPDRCDGMRVLDIGVRDGFFAFELERRGAAVVAIDYMDPAETGFPVARELLGSKVDYVVDNVYNVTAERYGTFDLVLFLGVMYHLRDPLLVLDRLWDVCNEDALLALETQVCDSALLLGDGSFTSLRQIDRRLDDLCLMQFHPGDSLHGDHTNYWSPTAACTRALMGAAGFEVVRDAVLGTRGIFVGRRVFESTQVYHRRIEKATIARGSGPQPARAAAAATDPLALERAGVGASDAGADELARARSQQLALESELARARLELETLRRGAGSPAQRAAVVAVVAVVANRLRGALAAARQRIR